MSLSAEGAYSRQSLAVGYQAYRVQPLGCAFANTQAKACTLYACSQQQLFPTHSEGVPPPGVWSLRAASVDRVMRPTVDRRPAALALRYENRGGCCAYVSGR